MHGLVPDSLTTPSPDAASRRHIMNYLKRFYQIARRSIIFFGEHTRQPAFTIEKSRIRRKTNRWFGLSVKKAPAEM
jgi:hypothetical protein